MALDAADWTVAVNGDVRWTGAGTATNVTVLELHRWLQDLADDAVAVQASSDLLDITDETPSDRATDNIITLINGYNIDDTAAEHIFDGSILQGSGPTETLYSGLVVLGTVEAGTQLIVIQDGALLGGASPFWGTGVNTDAANNIISRFMIKSREFGADIDGKRIIVMAREWNDTYAEFSVTLATGNSVAAISTSTDLNNQNSTVNASDGVINNTEGYQSIDITQDGSDEYYYSQWDWVSAPTGTTNKANDIYEYAKYIQRRSSTETLYGGMDGELFRGITHEIGYDGDTGTFTENGNLVWGTNVQWDTPLAAAGTVGEYYEFSDDGYTTIKAVGKLIGLDDDTTTGNAIFAMEPGGTALADGDTYRRADGTGADGATIDTTVTDGTAVGGEGRILAQNSTNGDTKVWIQLLSGVAPVDNLPIWDATTAGVFDQDAGSNALVNGSPSQITVQPVFVGQSTGSAIIGTVGTSFASNDSTQNDLFFDLENPGTQRQPPNNVDFEVNGAVSAEDYILVGPELAGALDKGQLTLRGTGGSAGAITVDNITAIDVDEPEPNNTPAAGTIRVVDDNGVERRLEYSSITDNTTYRTFNITTTDGNEDFASVNAAQGNDVYITYVDKVAVSDPEIVSFVFDGADTFFVRVRDGGGTPIKTFETTAPVGNSGGSATVIRTSDA